MIPDALVPVVVVVSATLVGALLWRLFKVAVKVVFAVVFVVIIACVVAWNRPDLARRAAVAAGLLDPAPPAGPSAGPPAAPR